MTTVPFLESYPDQGALLLSGPPGVGKFAYLIAALRAYLKAEQRVLFVCVDVGPPEILAHAFATPAEAKSHVGQTLRFVDCFTPSVSETPEAGEGSTLVSSFADLEGLGMAIAKGAAALSPPVRILFYTISTLYLHNSSGSLGKFFQIVSSRVKTQMGMILYAQQEGVTDLQHERLLASLVDGLVEMRFDAEMRHQIRFHHLRGHRVDPAWHSLEDGEPPEVEVTSTPGLWSLGTGGKGP